MKKKRYCLLLIMILLFCGACRVDEFDSVVTPTPSWQDLFAGNAVTEIPSSTCKPTATPIPMPQAEKMEQTYQPKEGQVELICLYDGNFTRLDDTTLFELNTRIAEKGYNFYISVLEEVRTDYVSGWCKKYLNSGNQVDLVCTSGNSGNSISTTTQTVEIIKAGLLLPYSEYPEIEEKSVLRGTYPESVWNMWSVMGEVYGVRYANYPFSPAVLTINLELAEKLEIKVPEYLTLTELDEYLELAAKNGYYPIVGGSPVLSYAGYDEVKPGLYVKVDETGIRAANPLEDEDLKEMLLTWTRYRENGWIEEIVYSREDGTSNRAALHNENTLFFTGLELDGQLTAYLEGVYRPYGKKESQRCGYDEIEVEVKCYKQGDYVANENDTAFLMGISTNSEHKEEALQFLTLLQTDEQIVRLMRYGVEGIHYVKGEDGYEETEIAAGGIDKLGNNFMYFEEYENISSFLWPSNYQEVLENLYKEDYTLVPHIEYTEEQIKVLRNVGKLMDSYGTLFQGKSDNVEEDIRELSNKLNDVGYNRVVAEINETYFGK
ncbi:MAG: hypothetical protein PUC30_04290 [Lachnospiraceae bacterium]|nr:hypothetical protein [Lachnospiraceae bacterium]